MSLAQMLHTKQKNPSFQPVGMQIYERHYLPILATCMNHLCCSLERHRFRGFSQRKRECLQGSGRVLFMLLFLTLGRDSSNKTGISNAWVTIFKNNIFSWTTTLLKIYFFWAIWHKHGWLFHWTYKISFLLELW